MKLRYALALLPLALAACDEQALSDLKFPWDKPLQTVPDGPVEPETKTPTPPAISPLDVPIEVADAEDKPLPTGEAATYQLTAVSARGNEPFWSVDVAGKTATYRTPENQSGRKISVNRLVYAKGVEFVGVLGDAPFSLNVRGVACTDSMSGEKFPLSATLRVGSMRAQGCARPTETATPSVSAEAPKPKPDTAG